MHTAFAIAPDSRQTPPDLAAEITRLSAYIHAASYRLLELIREFDEQELWKQCGVLSCAHWLSWKCGTGLNAAREKVRVAHALKQLPKISAAFAKGQISYSKVRAVTRAADAKNEDYLLGICRHGTASHVERLVARYRRILRARDLETANDQYAERSITCFYDSDGMLVIKGRLPAEQGALIMRAIEKHLDDHVSAETPVHNRRADALADIAEAWLNHPSNDGSTADRYQVVVHVSAETSDAHIEDGPHVSAETSHRVACDCSKLVVTDDDYGEPLSIGRKSRSIPPAMRRALRFRDKGCRFPGCTNTRYVDGHHIQHWVDGGETSMDNLVQLCRRHHRLVHEGGFGCERRANGDVVFRGLDGEELPQKLPRTGFEVRPDIDAWFDELLKNADIDEFTCIPAYCAGDRMDMDLAVSHLFAGPR